MTSAESDWKTFKRLRVIALDRFSQRILDQSQTICSKTALTAHERYGELYDLVRIEDKEMASMFDNFRRSSADLCLRLMVMHKLLTEEELSEFSAEMRRALSTE